VPLAADPSQMYGMAIHHAIRIWHLHRIKGLPIETADVIAALEGAWSSAGFLTPEHEERLLEQGRETLRRFVARDIAARLTPAAIEQEFRFRVGLDFVEGRWDRVDERPGGVVLVDYKTRNLDDPGSADERAKDSLRNGQLGLYALAWREMRGTLPAEVELLSSAPASSAPRPWRRTPGARRRARGRSREGHPRRGVPGATRPAQLQPLPLPAILPPQPGEATGMTPPTVESLRDSAAEFAREAGAIVLGATAASTAPEHKGRIDLVTEFDKRSEERLLARIRERFPGTACLRRNPGRTWAARARACRWFSIRSTAPPTSRTTTRSSASRSASSSMRDGGRARCTTRARTRCSPRPAAGARP